MKLISCYIDNFGGLSKFSMEFNDGLTVVQQPNGFGKTTLAEFIRAMFYGFPRKTPRTLSRREKYRPWNGGKCRGHLTFEHEGVRYRIERTFGTTPKGDLCKIYDLTTGQETGRFSSEIGVELFGLDADSFERSTYLPQNRENAPLTTDSIRAKLGDLVEDTDDVGNYEKAMEALRARRSAYMPFRGRGGAVAEDISRITRTQQALDAAGESQRSQKKAAAELAALEEEQTRLAAEIDTVRRELTDANAAALRRAHRLQYEKLTDSLNRTNGHLAELEGRYPKGFPDAQALDAVTDAVERAGRLAVQSVVTGEDRRAQRFVAEYQEHFAGGIPTGEEFDRIYQIRDQRRAAELQLEMAAMPEEEAAELGALDAFFTPGLPDEAVLARHEASLEEAARLRSENLRLASKTVEIPRYKVPSPLTVPLLLGGGAAAVLAGVLMMVRGNTAPGGATIALGVLALAAALWLALRSAMTRPVSVLSPQLQALVRENEERAAGLEEAVSAFTAEYGGVQPAWIRRRLERLHVLAQRDAALAKKRRALTAQLEEYDRELAAFFEKYHCRTDSSTHEALNRFQRACDTWERAQKQLADRDQRQAQHRQETEQVRQILDDFREAFAAAPSNREQVLAIREDVRQYDALTAAARDLEGQIARYRREYAAILASPVPETGEDPAVLRSREAELLARQGRNADRLARLGQQERQLRESADRIPQLQDELVRCQEQKREHEEKAALLDDTMAFLTRARDDLSTACMGPIRESFTALMARMAGEDPGKILMTPELDVQLERDGASRELAYFSAGQTDLVMLCMRLALVDALFRIAKPFVILDDPFVNLDDERTRDALALLQELSRDRQIIYLVCNSSRVSESFGIEAGVK